MSVVCLVSFLLRTSLDISSPKGVEGGLHDLLVFFFE